MVLGWSSATSTLAVAAVAAASLIFGLPPSAIAAAYVVAMLVLLFHLFHATRSVWQTLSLNHPAYVDVLRLASGALTFVIALGFAAIPLGVAAGIIGGGK